MSWQRAREEANRWIDRMQISRAMQGQAMNLSEMSRGKTPLAHQGLFRLMILRAAKRILVGRGINGYLDEADAAAERELPPE
jgi:hypothetical protein